MTHLRTLRLTAALQALALASLVAAPALAAPPRAGAKAASPEAKAPAKADAKAPAAAKAETKDEKKPAPAAGTPAAGAAPADGAPPADGAAPVAAPEPPPPPKPGHVVIHSDADDLVAQVDGALVGLKKGPNKVELKPGDYTIVVKTKKGEAVGSYKVTVQSEAEASVKVVTTGVIVLGVNDGSSLEVDGKKVAPKDGTAKLSVKAGKHSVVVKRPGFFGRKGDLDVTAGKTHSIDPALDKLKAGNKTLAWVGVVGGGALVLTGVLLEALVDANKFGGDATRWAVMGVGTAGFVGGTILMKQILKKENNPPVKPGTIKASVALSPATRSASLALRF